MELLTLSTCGIDEDLYCTMVLQLPQAVTEDTEEEQLQKQLDGLGLTAPPPSHAPVDSLTSSLSTNTFASNSTVRAPPSCLSSPSTAPSCASSSERRFAIHTSTTSDSSIQRSQSSSIRSYGDKRRSSGFGLGFLKMPTFKKRKSMPPWSPMLTRVSSDGNKTQDSDQVSQQSREKSLGSFESSKSSWSNAISAPKSSYEQPVPRDADALQRGLECQEMLELRCSQMAERDRFLDFQYTLLSRLGAGRKAAEAAKRKLQQAAMEEHQHKINTAVDNLEARQLEEEMKLQREHKLEEQRAMVRLRHMEAYCHSPTPLQTPPDPAPERSPTEAVLPERRVTEKDYHNLAQQYRERDSMGSLHASRVNVLRGKQNKTVENLVRKGMQEIDKMCREHERELEAIDKDFASQQDRLRLALASKRARLEMRWRTQALITRTQVERHTGLEHAALPDVTANQETCAPPVSG
ncbi:hypothetical protein DV736_g4780, partial [Chaetothyriales sp. CBS 134916]